VVAAEEPAPKLGEYIVTPGTKIPLGLLNSVGTRHSLEGDRVYLETVFPIVVNSRIVIPAGSYVAGTLTQVKRPERRNKDWHGKGRGELFLRFDSLILPNGVTRDFRARVSGVDGRDSEQLDRNEGKIHGEGDKGAEARTVGETAAAGTSIGLIAGSASHEVGVGAGAGAAAGATAGLMGVLLSRGPDVVLPKGSTIEMVTDRPISFQEGDLNFGLPQPGRFSDVPEPEPAKKSSGIAGRRWPS
jgi:type IV secretion system protein VirB10